MTRKFRRQPKDKKTGLPKVYLSGAKNNAAKSAEIKRTARLYRKGKLTKAMMDRISIQRSKG